MLDNIHFNESSDGEVKQLICLDGVIGADEALNFFKNLVDIAASKGKYISHIDNSSEISPQTGGNPGWGMTIKNKRGDLALITLKPIPK